MISFSHVTKRYGTMDAVHDLSFDIPRGQVVGLLGQNGAGKTTTLNMLTGYLAPSEGRITINDHDLLLEPRSAKQHLGYLPEVPPLYDEMTVESYLRFAAEMRLVVRRDIPGHVRSIAEKTGLSDMLSRRVGNLSKGYRQRVGLAQALCGDPDVLILDEPTVGLDPRQTAEFRETLRQIARDRTVIFSSHILSEVQSLCDRVLILHHGKLVYDPAEYEKVQTEEQKENLRSRRETECFSVINRGQLWYEGISLSQLLELRQWYKAWLNVTTTLVAPDKPKWLT